MKNHKNHHNGDGLKSQPVHLEFNHPTAAAVAIAGTFNDWRPEVTPMVFLGDGRWCKDLALPPGTYEYLFVTDGQWICDPRAAETVSNPFGNVNAVLKVPKEAESTVPNRPRVIPAKNRKEITPPTGWPRREARVGPAMGQLDARND